MFATTPQTEIAEHPWPTETFGEVLANCPLCFAPGYATDPACHSCGAEFEVGLMECARCSCQVSSAARACPSCGANLD